MALRSEIRQMLNEAGFNRNTIKELIKESLDDIVKSQVNQVIMEREEKDLAGVVSADIERRVNRIVKDTAEQVIREKIRWMRFNVNVEVRNEKE